MKHGTLEKDAVYDSNNVDSGNLSPFDEYTFIVVDHCERWGHTQSKVIVVRSTESRFYPEGTVHEINDAMWLQTGAKRIA